MIGGIIGAVAAVRVAMTSMPEMVALFNGFGGGASALVAAAVVWEKLVEPADISGTAAANLPGGGADTITISASIVIGRGPSCARRRGGIAVTTRPGDSWRARSSPRWPNRIGRSPIPTSSARGCDGTPMWWPLSSGCGRS